MLVIAGRAITVRYMADTNLDDFTAAAHTFLDAIATPKEPEKPFVWGEGEDRVGMFEESKKEDELAAVAAAKTYRAQKFDAGFGWITGPKEYGGSGLTSAHERAFGAIESEYEVPGESVFMISLGMVAPTILAHGTDLAKDRYIKALWRGDIIACQLFSEPGAGSDLAGLQTKAERDGDEWILNGQKVWTTFAQHAQIGEVIARTDPNLPKHAGLTGFIVDMHAPGVEVRPLRQMTGGASFNEVFFTDVRVPDDHRLSDVNNGWNVALTTLMNERAAIGAAAPSGVTTWDRLREMARHYDLMADPVLRDELMQVYMHSKVARLTNQRAMDKIKSGQLPGPEMSIAKLAGTQNMERVSDFLSHALGAKLIADNGEWGTYAWSQMVLGGPGGRIAGGTDEVMRNIVGERVLGLPKDPGIDSKSPFKDLRTN